MDSAKKLTPKNKSTGNASKYKTPINTRAPPNAASTTSSRLGSASGTKPKVVIKLPLGNNALNVAEKEDAELDLEISTNRYLQACMWKWIEDEKIKKEQESLNIQLVEAEEELYQAKKTLVQSVHELELKEALHQVDKINSTVQEITENIPLLGAEVFTEFKMLLRELSTKVYTDGVKLLENQASREQFERLMQIIGASVTQNNYRESNEVLAKQTKLIQLANSVSSEHNLMLDTQNAETEALLKAISNLYAVQHE